MDEQDTPRDPLPADELLAQPENPRVPIEDVRLRAMIEAIIYVAEEPVTAAQVAVALEQAPDRVQATLDGLIRELDKPERGVTIREVAGGYKMATKPEHHEAVRAFVKSLKAPLKLSLPALETLAVIAYKQPVTAPEIMEIRGVQGTGVLKTLLDRKLIAVAGRKAVIGKPILYKTTRDFLIQFGLKDLSELPSLKEFEEIRRMAMADSDVAPDAAPPEPAAAGGASPEASEPAGPESAPPEPPEPAGREDASPEPPEHSSPESVTPEPPPVHPLPEPEPPEHAGPEGAPPQPPGPPRPHKDERDG